MPFFPYERGRRTTCHTGIQFHSSKISTLGELYITPFPIQPTMTANCWAKTSLLVPNDSRCPVTTLVTRTHRDKPDTDRDGVERQVSLPVWGEGVLGRGDLRSDQSLTLGTWGGSRGSPVLKELFAWTFKDHAQDQAPGIRKLQSMPGRSPEE